VTLTLANVEVVYSDVVVGLRGVSLTVPPGAIVALLGANGAGKTTCLRAISGLLDVHNGKITKGAITFEGAHAPDGAPCCRARARRVRARARGGMRA
jgi:ABC-type branched-subunit amino acid transport system ATPase component